MFRSVFRLSDKNIGIKLIDKGLINKRFYVIKSDDWDIYTNNINNTRARQFTHYTADEALNDTVFMQNQEIMNLKADISMLHSRINKLTNTIVQNNNDMDKRIFAIAHKTDNRLTSVETEIEIINSTHGGQ